MRKVISKTGGRSFERQYKGIWRTGDRLIINRMVIHDWERLEYKQLVTKVGFKVDR